MGISLYNGISKREIEASRITSEGKEYTLNHPSELLVDMRYKGDNGNNANSQGWERSSSYYFDKIRERHPEYFSKKNNMLMESGKSPVVDKKFAEYFPQYRDYKGETLVHHHIGQDGQAVALPQSIHKGYGEIHTIEHNLGITDKAQTFSNSCKAACQKNSSLYGQTSNVFRTANNSENKTTVSTAKNVSKKIESKNAVTGATHIPSSIGKGHALESNSNQKSANKNR